MQKYGKQTKTHIEKQIKRQKLSRHMRGKKEKETDEETDKGMDTEQ